MIPFKLAKEPSGSKRLPVYAGDDMDVVFRNSYPSLIESRSLGSGVNANKKWAQNKFSVLKRKEDLDVTVKNPILRKGDKPKRFERNY